MAYLHDKAQVTSDYHKTVIRILTRTYSRKPGLVVLCFCIYIYFLERLLWGFKIIQSPLLVRYVNSKYSRNFVSTRKLLSVVAMSAIFINSQVFITFFFFLPLSHKVGSVQHVFHHIVIKIRQLFLRPAVCLTSTLKLEQVLTTANAAGNNGLTCLPKHGGSR
jgi:hypothetical protein